MERLGWKYHGSNCQLDCESTLIFEKPCKYASISIRDKKKEREVYIFVIQK